MAFPTAGQAFVKASVFTMRSLFTTSGQRSKDAPSLCRPSVSVPWKRVCGVAHRARTRHKLCVGCAEMRIESPR